MEASVHWKSFVLKVGFNACRLSHISQVKVDTAEKEQSTTTSAVSVSQYQLDFLDMNWKVQDDYERVNEADTVIAQCSVPTLLGEEARSNICVE